jgi:hypothetical protein
MQQVEKQDIFEGVDAEEVAADTLEKRVLDSLRGAVPGYHGKRLGSKVYRAYLRGDNTYKDLVASVGMDLFDDATVGAEQVEEALESVLEKVGVDSSDLLEDCPVCRSPLAAEIDKDLLALSSGLEGQSYFALYARYQISQHLLMVHAKDHLLPEIYAYVDKVRSAERQRV